MFNIPDFRNIFKQLCNEDVDGAGFKIGEQVIYRRTNREHIGTIEGVNFVDEGVYEYLVSGMSHLVYEQDIERWCG